MLKVQWRDYFYYDETSPSGLRWKINTSNCKKLVGDMVGCKNYRNKTNPANWVLGLNGGTYILHRVVWEMFNGTIPEGMVIDHLDGNPFNNKLSNLQCKTPKGNSQNKKKYNHNTSGFTGVTFVMGGRDNKATRVKAFVILDKGKELCKHWGVKKHGLLPAYYKACVWRLEQLHKLNQAGQQYTFREYEN